MKTLLRGAGTVVLWIAGLGLLGGLITWQAGSWHPKISPVALARSQPESVAPDRILEVTHITEPLQARIPGTMAARHEAVISARVMATIQEIMVNAGDTVELEQVLVVLDSRDLSARLAQARFNLEAGQSRLALATREFARAEELFRNNVLPRTEYDRAASGIEVASAEVDRLRRSVEEAEVTYSFTHITAPLAGRVVDRLADPGDTITPGQPLIKLYDPSRLRLEAHVREALATRMKRGDQLAVFIDSLGEQLTGTVEELVPQADPGARSMLVKVALPQREELYPGLFGRLLIPQGEAVRLYIPAAAIRRIGQLTSVEMVSPEGHRLGKRYIQTGRTNATGQIEVLSGLQPGEYILAEITAS